MLWCCSSLVWWPGEDGAPLAVGNIHQALGRPVGPAGSWCGMLADMFPPARPRTVLVIAAAADQAPDMDQVRPISPLYQFPSHSWTASSRLLWRLCR